MRLYLFATCFDSTSTLLGFAAMCPVPWQYGPQGHRFSCWSPWRPCPGTLPGHAAHAQVIIGPSLLYSREPASARWKSPWTESSWPRTRRLTTLQTVPPKDSTQGSRAKQNQSRVRIHGKHVQSYAVVDSLIFLNVLCRIYRGHKSRCAHEQNAILRTCRRRWCTARTAQSVCCLSILAC